MKQVEFVRVKSELSGYVPIETRGTGDIETMSLIFQREEQEIGGT